MMRIEPELKLAIALHSSPGVYALLLGSGLSSAAGIPTGWQVTLDLIRQLAATQEVELADDAEAEAWYRETYGKEPDYSALLDALTSTSDERQMLLRSYFEPTDEEREEGKKIPTDAHRAIARMVRDENVRMILTTNFDRLPARRGKRHERVAGLRRLGDRAACPQVGRDQRQVGPFRELRLEDRDERLGGAELLDAPDDEVPREGEQRQRCQVELQRPDLDLVSEVDVPFEVRIDGAEGRLARIDTDRR